MHHMASAPCIQELRPAPFPFFFCDNLQESWKKQLKLEFTRSWWRIQQLCRIRDATRTRLPASVNEPSFSFGHRFPVLRNSGVSVVANLTTTSRTSPLQQIDKQDVSTWLRGPERQAPVPAALHP
jgi:hypothetical protein